MEVKVPELSLVALIGPSGSGKSTFAAKHFLPTEVVSSDACRGLVSDDANSLDATRDAFDLLYYIVRKRLARGRLTVLDATNVIAEDRRAIVHTAREYHCLPAAIVFNLAEKICHERNRERTDRNIRGQVIAKQHSAMRRSLRRLKREGFRNILVLNSPEEVDSVQIVCQPMWCDKRDQKGPFDVIGDVHGCYDELKELLQRLGYRIEEKKSTTGTSLVSVEPPEGRKAVFIGDIVDRGPRIPEVLRLVMHMTQRGTGICLPGNHDVKLKRVLEGKNVKVQHGLAESLEQLGDETEEFRRNVHDFIDKLVSHYVLDGGKLVVAHAGMKEEMQGRGSGKVRGFALYGETTGEIDEFGLPVRYKWAEEYRGKALVVYGHTPVPEPEWLNRTVNIDTGCVFGGKLTGLRYPEMELVSVKAARTYSEPVRPLEVPAEGSSLSAQQIHDDLLHIEDVLGKRVINTEIQRAITIRDENAGPALEVMSRFAANPKWLIYLPPTMSPSETSKRAGLLEHPDETFGYFRSRGINRVICEEKHMGSRAVVIICRDEAQAAETFGVEQEAAGICYSRTGRKFFNDPDIEIQLLDEVRAALTQAGFWDMFATGWVCLDCELMPWSAKARDLLRLQYAAVGAAGSASFPEALSFLRGAAGRDIEGIEALQSKYRERHRSLAQYVEAYRCYCWDVSGIGDYRLAPFQILATEGAAHTNRDHVWHMENIASIIEKSGSSLLQFTPYRVVDLDAQKETKEAIEWWNSLTEKGGEGMVVKPLDYVARGIKGYVQPAIKCRGREYLRIIYGPEYTLSENLERLRSRGLGRKRSLAMREFALGVEALKRFVARDPLRRVHECVLGILALESEPVDPRL